MIHPITIFAFLSGIILHELGHLLMARFLGISVRKVCIFFDPLVKPIFTTGRRFKTEYAIGWLPLGGYLILGSSKDITDSPSDPLFTLPFRKKVPIILAGVASNFLTAILLLTILVTLNPDLRSKRKELGVPRLTCELTYAILSNHVTDMGYANQTSHESCKVKVSPSYRPAQTSSNRHVRTSRTFRFLFFIIDTWLFLALFNILPIPSLDGAIFLFSLVECLLGKKIPPILYVIFTLIGIGLITLWNLHHLYLILWANSL